jgi:hypothetical protein
MKRLPLVAFVLAAACAGEGPVYEDKYAYDVGWRVGRVTHVVDSTQAVDERSSKDCRLGARAEGHGARTFARVSLQWGRYYKSIIAMVPANDRVSVGEDVYVDYQDCGKEVAPRHKGRSH